MKSLEEDVQQVRTCRATLGEAIGSQPGGAVHPSITKAAAYIAVERNEAVHHGLPDTCTAKHPEDSPPGQRVEALLDIEARQPELSTATTLQQHQILQELGDVEGAGLCPKPKSSLPQEGRLQRRCPLLHGALAPHPINELQHCDGPLVPGTRATSCLRDHRDVGLQHLLRPTTGGLHQCQQAGDGCMPCRGQTPPHSNGHTRHAWCRPLTHRLQHPLHPLPRPRQTGPCRRGDMLPELGGRKGVPALRSVQVGMLAEHSVHPVAPYGRVHGLRRHAL